MPVITRRATLAALGMAVAAPPAAAAEFAPVAPGLSFALSLLVTIAPPVEVGPTPLGIRRRIAITGGSFEGPRIRGKVLSGGADWQLQRADDFTVLDADYMIQADDGALIHVRNIGVSNSRVVGAAARYTRTAPVFEAPRGPHAWLNEALFVGTLTPQPGRPVPAVRIDVFAIT